MICAKNYEAVSKFVGVTPRILWHGVYYCCCSEEFNNALLTPELSETQLQDLHKQLSDLYRMYIDPASADCIRLDDDIISQLRTSMLGIIYWLCS